MLRLLNWTREYFETRQVDSPRLAAEMLLAYTLGCKRIELYTRFDTCPPADQIAAFRELVRRGAEHEPVAYLVGEKEFYSLAFKVTPDVLIPRPETELLVTAAVEHLRQLGRPGSVWDICTGSGCVAVTVACQVESARVLATDISPEAIAIAAENAEANGAGDRIRTGVADLLTPPADAADMVPVDVITANPPYVATGDEVAPSVVHEPEMALYAGADGLDCIRRIVAAAPDMLAPGGLLAMEFGCGQADAVRDLLVAGEAFNEPTILRDHQGIERCVTASRK